MKYKEGIVIVNIHKKFKFHLTKTGVEIFKKHKEKCIKFAEEELMLKNKKNWIEHVENTILPNNETVVIMDLVYMIDILEKEKHSKDNEVAFKDFEMIED